LKHGVLLVSVYLYDGEADGPKNADLLQAIGGILRSIGQPFICGGDFQMSPRSLQELGWPGIVDGTICSANTATYESGEASTEIDFFVVSNSIAPNVFFCATRPTDCIKKHIPVMITVSGEDRTRVVDVIRRPPKLSLNFPKGCAPPPPAWEGFEEIVRGIDSQERLNNVFTIVRGKIVEEIVGVLQVPDPSATITSLQRPFKVVKQSAFRASTGQPAADFLGTMWRHLHTRILQWQGFRDGGSYWWARCLWISLKRYLPPFSFDLVPLDSWTTWRYFINRIHVLDPIALQDLIVFLDAQALSREQIAATDRLTG